jgi:hypothetical protein
MKIQQKKVTRQVTFSSLNYGGTFREVNSDPTILWMKTEFIEADDDVYNAVDLSDGQVAHFDTIENVIPVKATVVVEEED